MTRGVIGRVVLGVWLGCATAAAQLPPEVLVDKYLLQAQMLSEEKHHKGALEAMDRIVALQKEHDLTLPEEFSFHYAQTALAAGSVQAAIGSANRYLSVAGREGKYYREALELLVKAERIVRETTPDPVETGTANAEIEPQPQPVPPASPQARTTTAARPAAECRKWNKKKFFKKATVQDVIACLRAGADPNVQGKWQRTPLHRAAGYNKNVEVVRALIDAGANQMAWNKWGQTPLQGSLKRHRKVLRDAWASLSDSEKEAQQERARRQKSQSAGSGWAALVAGVTGAAIGASGGVDAGTATELGATIGGSVLAGEAGGNTAGVHSPTPTGADGSSSEFDTALRNLENSCGERYRSAFSDQDHGRFYCLDAFARHCALKKRHNQRQLDALRHDFEVLRSQGLETKCPYFGVLGGTNAPGSEREAIDRAEKEAGKARQEEQRRLEEQGRQAAQQRKRRIEENNARVLASDCDCISKDERDGKLTCLDGFVGLTESHCNFRFRRR